MVYFIIIMVHCLTPGNFTCQEDSTGAQFVLCLYCIAVNSLYSLQTWKPRWGFKRANDNTNEWLIEVPGNAGKDLLCLLMSLFCLYKQLRKIADTMLCSLDPYEDQFLKREQEKKERVAKNDFQRLKNIGRSQKSM